jgi:hypothetical protein
MNLTPESVDQKKRSAIILILVLLVLLLAGVLVWKKIWMQQKSSVHSFAECAAAGLPVTESFPRGCRAGKITFLEDVEAVQQEEPVLVPELASGALAQSPFAISGKALGTWYFEAVFPVKLYDANGVLLASGQATALADWMTAGYVPFSVSLDFKSPSTASGYLDFEKSNPSGLPENSGFVRVQVNFR